MASNYEKRVLPRLDEVEAWRRDGVSERDIAGNLHVAYSSFRKYKSEHAELAEALRKSKEYVDSVIVRGAYLRRITGYDVVETTNIYEIRDGVQVLTGVKEQTRHIPGDPRAAEYWLSRGSAVSDTAGVVIIPAAELEDAPEDEQ